MFFDKTASDLQHNNMVSITYPNHLKLQINYSVAYMPEKKMMMVNLSFKLF